MSTRCYPLFIKGNPQLRVFMPNFWMKLVKHQSECPPNMVKFIVSIEMTNVDVKNYLEKIYNVPVKEVLTKVMSGEFKKDITNQYIIKEDDYKVAHVLLPAGHTFEFPNLNPEEKKKELEKDQQIQNESAKAFKEKKAKNWDRPGIPSWFGV